MTLSCKCLGIVGGFLLLKGNNKLNLGLGQIYQILIHGVVQTDYIILISLCCLPYNLIALFILADPCQNDCSLRRSRCLLIALLIQHANCVFQNYLLITHSYSYPFRFFLLYHQKGL